MTLSSDLDGEVGTTTATAVGVWTITASTLREGSHGLTATATDAAGNTSDASSSLSVTIDTSEPSPTALDLDSGSDSGSSSSDDLTNEPTPDISGSAAASVLVMLSSDLDGVVGSTTSDGSGNWTITSSTLQEGAHSLTATASDAAGNVSSDSTALSVTVDTTSPAIATSVSANNGDGTYGDTNTLSPQVTFGEVVYVDTTGGTPTLTLDMDTTDRDAVYVSGSGTTTLTFDYTIVVGDNASDLDYASVSALALNGATLTDDAGNVTSSSVTLPSPGGAGSLSATKDLVVSTNQTPVADAQNVGVNEDTDLTVTLTGSDADSDPITMIVSTLPANGSLYQTSDGVARGSEITSVPTTVSDGSGRVIYAPTPDGNGAGYGSFGFAVNDGLIDSSEATVSLDVNAVNDAPLFDAVSNKTTA